MIFVHQKNLQWKKYSQKIDTEFGEFELNVWEDVIFKEHHFSLSKGEISKAKSPVVRVQTHSVLQDTLGIKEVGKNGQLENHWKDFQKRMRQSLY